MLAIGYTLSFIVPYIGGAVWDATQLAATAFIPSALGALVLAIVAATMTSLPRRG